MRINRREFCTAVAATTLTGPSAFASKQDRSVLPQNVAQKIDGVYAYAAHSVAAGEEIAFHVSASHAYRFSLVRLGSHYLDSSGDGVLVFEQSRRAAPHPIHPGSCVVVTNVPELPKSFSVSLWVRPFRIDGPRQSLLSHSRDDVPKGWDLAIDEGKIVLTGWGMKLVTKKQVIKNRDWQHIAASITPTQAVLWHDGSEVARLAWSPDMRQPRGVPMRLAASGRGDRNGHFLDGDLAAVMILPGAVEEQAIGKLFESQALSLPKELSPLAHWTFHEEVGETVADATGKGHDGLIINRATWMIGGPSFDAAQVDRFDKDYAPTRDPRRGHGLRFSADDLYDCQWPVAHRVKIPADAASGFYCGRFHYEDDNGKTLEHNYTFVVKAPAIKTEPAPILVLAATKTWRAYNWFPFSRNLPHGRHPWGQGNARNLNPGHKLPSYCLYRDHSAGQPTYQVGLNLPMPAGDPYRTYRGQELWGQWVANERLVHHWLDRHEYDYEVVTDFDLDADAGVLDGRKTLFIVGHSEYWSDAAYQAVDAFLKRGGNLVVLSANTMFWRVDMHRPGIMGCRKFPRGMLGSAWTRPGEVYHGPDKDRGGLMRFSGNPAWKVVGMETAGWGRDFLPYTVTHADHPFFHEPHEVGLKEGDTFGFFGDGTGMVGHEYDVRPSVLVGATKTMPPGYEDVADPPGMTVLAACLSDRKIIDYHANENLAADNPSGAISEILYWERPEGGRVFNIGSVSGPWGLHDDNHVSLLVRNVLHHFGHSE